MTKDKKPLSYWLPLIDHRVSQAEKAGYAISLTEAIKWLEKNHQLGGQINRASLMSYYSRSKV